ncbi:hypothetical protein PHYBLDRAFT_67913 [Phycomyces blakesleeanus NRRL 1555(-)]|uniref:Uncharacterized protein n=1 Tax=Phycomyces blakesleeanus (strain ATCC 8743b / DSM 1359 / FGSC 10004 / NBRC 33097 / NRRL 1555) TaxID=763407 RepID=A0A163AQV4_PHYB8|nr:hypothetical protein PHYBLDRAFT_67913 [Phycomyces blakesleeanus NRRL 1555(-)]OAD75151.1 hypothetical protein PHYBLDRAFT_67913 [Phycomyces blakesleeanus NRRL 1555(-)]|eukprot:XP_018293191.1 hypothetical protein PHYBLDRAFT_67913 [Phycomyces blakesleeanus NRRL 1555(-)]
MQEVKVKLKLKLKTVFCKERPYSARRVPANLFILQKRNFDSTSLKVLRGSLRAPWKHQKKYIYMYSAQSKRTKIPWSNLQTYNRIFAESNLVNQQSRYQRFE